jgi:hypothetical protein
LDQNSKPLLEKLEIFFFPKILNCFSKIGHSNTLKGEHTLLQLAAEVLFRPIVIIPVCPEETTTRIEPLGVVTANLPPLYLLYFSEISFRNGHYQSIRPNSPQIDTEF